MANKSPEPPSGMVAPHFGGVATFMRLGIAAAPGLLR
jgi:hypothetical protein